MPRRNKFGVDISPQGRKNRTYMGRVYDSLAEMHYAMDLQIRLLSGDISAWEPQFRIPMVVNGFPVGDFIPDFRVTNPDGSVELVEVKGRATSEFWFRKSIFEATYLQQNPNVAYYIRWTGPPGKPPRRLSQKP